MNYLSNLRLTFYWIKGHTQVFIKNAAFTHKDLWKRLCDVVEAFRWPEICTCKKQPEGPGASSVAIEHRLATGSTFVLQTLQPDIWDFPQSWFQTCCLWALWWVLLMSRTVRHPLLSSTQRRTAQLICSWRSHSMCLVAVSGRTVCHFQAESSIGGWPSRALLPCRGDLGSTGWDDRVPDSPDSWTTWWRCLLHSPTLDAELQQEINFCWMKPLTFGDYLLLQQKPANPD